MAFRIFLPVIRFGCSVEIGELVNSLFVLDCLHSDSPADANVAGITGDPASRERFEKRMSTHLAILLRS